MSVHGGQPERITYEGDYNARGMYSPDGKSLCLVHGNGGDYRIAVLDIASKQLRVLSAGNLDESPSFAPNGSIILYASQNGEKSGLSTVSSNGKVKGNLHTAGSEMREPAWSP